VAVKVRENEGPLEPITWPTGEVVDVKRPNIYASKFWNSDVVPAMAAGGGNNALDALVKFVAMICPSKTEEQIAQECDEPFLLLVCGYAREALEQAQEFVASLLGKSVGATVPPASVPETPSGTSPVGSPAPTAVPCGT
jgi:hypothetical protein